MTDCNHIAKGTKPMATHPSKFTIDSDGPEAAIEGERAPAGRWKTITNERSSKAAALLSREEDRQQAMSDYMRRQKAEQEKTTRLRALRLAKEAADRAAADEAASAPPKRAAR